MKTFYETKDGKKFKDYEEAKYYEDNLTEADIAYNQIKKYKLDQCEELEYHKGIEYFVYLNKAEELDMLEEYEKVSSKCDFIEDQWYVFISDKTKEIEDVYFLCIGGEIYELEDKLNTMNYIEGALDKLKEDL